MNANTMNTDNDHMDPVPGLLPKVFEGEATPEEKKQVEDWLSASEANQAEYDAVLKLWNLAGAASEPGDIDIDREWQKMESVITPSISRKITLVRFLQIAASVIVVSSLAFIGLHLTGTRSEKAPANRLSVVTLPDGSTVFLNAASKITYRKGFGLTHRNLAMKGEAYFEVKKDARLPFLITAGGARVQVTGTEFNVKDYQNKRNIKVTVTKGRVLFYNKEHAGDKITLGAGETGMYNKKSGQVKKLHALNLNDLAWKTRVIDFHDTPLMEVVDILTNTYHQSVELDPSLKNCTITVRFENQELKSVLEVLKSTLGLELVTRGKRIIISGKGC